MDNHSYNYQTKYSPPNRPLTNSGQNTDRSDFREIFQRPPIKHRRKFSWFFAVLALGIVVLGSRYIYQNIRGSVSYNVPGFVTNQLAVANDQQSIDKMKQSDTDQDGLTDYQEVYQYHTSMFLPDTDSDGISDYNETISGDDPLCPRGQNCNILKLITPTTKIAEVIQEVTVDPNLTFQDAMVAEFRKFLLDSGIAKEEIDKLSNEELLLIMDALDSSGIFSEEAMSATTTPAEIRQFLLSQPGTSADEINKLSDADLLKIRDKILEK